MEPGSCPLDLFERPFERDGDPPKIFIYIRLANLDLHVKVSTKTPNKRFSHLGSLRGECNVHPCVPLDSPSADRRHYADEGIGRRGRTETARRRRAGHVNKESKPLADRSPFIEQELFEGGDRFASRLDRFMNRSRRDDNIIGTAYMLPERGWQANLYLHGGSVPSGIRSTSAIALQ